MTLVVLAASLRAPALPADVEVESPDGLVAVQVNFRTKPIELAVSHGGRYLIEPSPVSFTLDGVDLCAGAEAGEPQRYEVNEKYPWRGVHAVATDHCRGARVPVTHEASGTRYTLELRAYDDGVAFRFVVPDVGRPRVPDESTTFLLPRGTQVWSHDLGGHYEATYDQWNVEAVKAGQWCAPPVTFKLVGDAGYGAITEAALLNYSGMALQTHERGGLTIVLGHKHPLNRPFELRYGKEEHERLSRPAATTGEIVTPWRVIVLGKDLNTLVNSDLLHNLCPPPDA